MKRSQLISSLNLLLVASLVLLASCTFTVHLPKKAAKALGDAAIEKAYKAGYAKGFVEGADKGFEAGFDAGQIEGEKKFCL